MEKFPKKFQRIKNISWKFPMNIKIFLGNFQRILKYFLENSNEYKIFQ